MDFENELREDVPAFLGQKSALPHKLLTAADCERVRNFFSRRGRLRKAWGAPLYANPDLAGAVGRVSWIDRYLQRWVYQQGKVLALESAEGSANFVKQGEILKGEEARVFSALWVDRLYMANGCEIKLLEKTVELGQKYLNLGLLPPGLGRKWVAGQGDLTLTKVPAVGSTLADATYGYVITFWDANRRVESLPWGAQVGEDGLWVSFARSYADFTRLAFTGMANNAVRVDISALKALGYDADRVTHFIVYRQTQADEGTLKRVADPDDELQEPFLRIANDFYDDSTEEADLGLVLDESLSPPPTGKYYFGYGDLAQDASVIGPRFLLQHRDQLFLFGADYPGTENGTELQPDGVNAKKIQYYPQSGILYGSEVGNPDYWRYTWDVGRATGQKDTGMAKIGNSVGLFKERSAYYLEGTQPENYEVREMDPKKGIIAPGSLQSTSIGAIGLGEGGFTLFDALAPGKIISDEIADEVAKINLEHLDKITSAFDEKEEKYECHVPVENDRNTMVFVYDLKSRSWAFTTRAGGAAAYSLSSTRRSVGLFGDKLNGRLYDANDLSAVTKNGETMHGLWRSKAFDFGTPGLKNLQMVEIVARGIFDFRLSIDVIPDFGQGDAVSINDIDPDVRGDKWAAEGEECMRWDDLQWNRGSEKKKFTVLVQCIGEFFNLVVRNSDKDANRASFEIEQITLYANRLSGSDEE